MTKLNYVIVLGALALGANFALAATVDTADSRGDPVGGLDTTTLLQFYPTPLATSPVGAIEDKAVWLAKVQGLIDDAPPLLQQSMLTSKTQKQFAANLALLQQLQKGTLEGGIVAANSLAKSGKLATKAADGKIGPNLGSGPADTVFTYLEPCRIMDTRNATLDSGVRGPLVGNQLYQLPGFLLQIATQNWGVYGGNASSTCGLNSVVGANIWALAVVITILNPNFDSFLGVGDKGTLAETLSTVALNYTHGQGLSTQYIVPQGIINTIYFAMPAQLTANIIFDVVGYFATSSATPLTCNTYQSVGAGSFNVAAGGGFGLSFPACPISSTQTGVGCYAGYSNNQYWLNDISPVGGNCYWHNASGSALSGTAFRSESICCSVPGR